MEIFSHVWQHYSVEILVAAIIAGVALFARLLAALLTSMFSPVKISGGWETKLDRGSGLTKHEDATIHQVVHRVWGRTIRVDGQVFRVTGTIVGDRVCLVYRAKGPATDFGANLLRIM